MTAQATAVRLLADKPAPENEARLLDVFAKPDLWKPAAGGTLNSYPAPS